MMKNDFLISAKAEADKGIGELLIYGDISDSNEWGEEEIVIPSDVDKALKQLKDCKQINIRINSYGGSVFAGQAIVSMLKRFKGYKTVYIDGIAASMGSVIAMAGDKIIMPENATMMIHKPVSMAYGNANDLRHEAEVLDTAEKTLIALYMGRFKGTEDELKKLLNEETWLTAQEALNYGLCDEIEKPVKIAASAKGIKIGEIEIPQNTKIYNKIKELKGECIGMEENPVYAQIKEKFGVVVDEEDTLETAIEKISKAIDDKAKTSVESKSPQDVIADFVKEKLGKELKADEILAIISEHNELKDKAKEYDNLKASAIEKALKNGIKAKGERFNKDVNEKLLKGLSLAEIEAIADEWEEDAKLALNAGKRVSEYTNNKEVTKITNIEDFKF